MPSLAATWVYSGFFIFWNIQKQSAVGNVIQVNKKICLMLICFKLFYGLIKNISLLKYDTLQMFTIGRDLATQCARCTIWRGLFTTWWIRIKKQSLLLDFYIETNWNQVQKLNDEMSQRITLLWRTENILKKKTKQNRREQSSTGKRICYSGAPLCISTGQESCHISKQ